MPRGKQLSDEEKGRITALFEEKVSLRGIARKIGRSLCCVQNFLKFPALYASKKRSGRKRKLNERAERRIVHASSNASVSLNQLRSLVDNKISRSATWRTIKRAEFIEYSKKKKITKLSLKHKKARIEFARNNIDTNWNKIIFSDEKKWNLDGPDGSRGYYHDIRQEPLTFSKRNFGGGNVMTWAAFSAEGCINIEFVSSRMKSKDYIEVLEKALLPFLNENESNEWVFQQDNAAIHVSRETKSWFQSKGINILSWPACSPDLNPIENLWGILSQRVYQNNRQFNTVPELMRCIKAEWSKIEAGTITNLVLSMEKRINNVLLRNGNSLN